MSVFAGTDGYNFVIGSLAEKANECLIWARIDRGAALRFHRQLGEQLGLPDYVSLLRRRDTDIGVLERRVSALRGALRREKGRS